MRATACGLLRTRFWPAVVSFLVFQQQQNPSTRLPPARGSLPSGRRCVWGTKRAPARSRQR